MSEEKMREIYREVDPQPLNDHGFSLEYAVNDLVDAEYHTMGPVVFVEQDSVASNQKSHLKLIPGGMAVEQLVRAA